MSLCHMVPASALLALACSTHVVNEFPDRTVRSDTLSRSIRLELTQNPSVADPRVVFRSAEETEYVDEVEHTTEYAYRPKPALTWTLLGSSVMALLLSSDMRKRGFADYATIASATALTTALSGCFLYIGLPLFHHRAIRHEAVSGRSSAPLDVEVSLNGSPWHRRLNTGSDCLAELELTPILDSLPARKSIGFEAHVADVPEHTCSVEEERSVVDSLVERQATGRQLKEEEERRRREARQQRLRAAEEQRQAEAEAASRAWRSLTSDEQGMLTRCFNYATTDFQLAIIQATELKTYGAFLALSPEGRIRVLRQIGSSIGIPTWSILLQQQLGLPAYLAEAVLAGSSRDVGVDKSLVDIQSANLDSDSAALDGLHLKAITLGGDRPYALINDQILRAGDEIGGMRIVNIESDKVIFERDGTTFTLLLGE
jgi:hypothetical protein